MSEPHGIAHSLFFASVVHQWRGEHSKALERAEASIAVSREHGLLLYQATSSVARGRVLIDYGRLEEAVEQIRQGLAAHQATGTELLRPQFVALLAEAFIAARRPSEGLHALEQGLASAQNSGDRYYEAELYRLRGELLLLEATPAPADATACFRKAIEIARKQKARSLELRAAMSLARIYQSQDRREQGRDILAPIYTKFTEGFDTLDLLQARKLLDQLA